MLEDELRRARVENIKDLLSSPNYTMVLISGNILAGAQGRSLRYRGDVADRQPGDQSARRRAARMLPSRLRLDQERRPQLPPAATNCSAAAILGKDKGPLIAAEGDGDPAANARRARIWDGGVSFIDRPFYLVLKNDKKFASVAAGIADRINMLFPDDPVKRLT